MDSKESDDGSPMDILAAARARMASIEALVHEEPTPTPHAETKPPPGLSPDEEVAWWKNRISELSAGGGGLADDKENRTQSRVPFERRDSKASPAQSKGEYSNRAGYKGAK
jgi:hypothetical protein